jgi:hypothetical protein
LQSGSMNTHFALLANSTSSAFSASRLSPPDKPVVKYALVRHALPGVVAAGRVLERNARLQPEALVFAVQVSHSFFGVS